MVYPHTGILLSNIKHELLTQAATWINLKSIISNERSQTQKSIYQMILFIRNSRKRIITESGGVGTGQGGV